ncbi:hypothetical protein E2C01_045826 [Portunus trituberculatus]|uniref:Uncharacterized protein n=1 Tax=Portunus trituberculatus TaxID=210409 RepID=A0A5B7G460_PORTR|nr:hypothetical protein [Portunus trituberculatus]
MYTHVGLEEGDCYNTLQKWCVEEMRESRNNGNKRGKKREEYKEVRKDSDKQMGIIKKGDA